MHYSKTSAYDMGETYSNWFSSCFRYQVRLIYLGDNLRAVLGNVAPGSGPSSQPETQSSSLVSTLWSYVPSVPFSPLASSKAKEGQYGITFADVATYLFVTTESLADVSSRLSGGIEMDVTKLRPNIVVSGADSAWEEDFWGGVRILPARSGNSDKEIDAEEATDFTLTANCVRCKSLNIDYNTGDYGKGEEGTVLKKLMKDRRVDTGTKYSPVFGRYGFFAGEGKKAERNVSVGDEVVVTVRNKQRTSFGKLGIPSHENRLC